MSFIKKSWAFCFIDYSQQTEVLYVHGDCQPELQVKLTVQIDGHQYLTVGQVKKLPILMFLGPDLPVLYNLLSGVKGPGKANEPVVGQETHVSYFVMTWFQTKEGTSPIRVTSSAGLCDSLFKALTKGPRKTHRQRRLEKHVGG